MIKKTFLTIALVSLFPLAAAADETPRMPSEAFADSSGEPDLPNDAQPVTANAPDGTGGATASPNGVSLYIISPMDGDTVTSPVTVSFGLQGMGVAPAGVEKEGTGHHHLIVDAPLPPVDEPIISDENNLHFGGGQTQADVPLSRGEHTLQLIMGNHNHIPHDPAVISTQIRIVVE